MFSTITQNQKNFFNTSHPFTIDWRIAQLKKLKDAIKKNEKEILTALKADLNKPSLEAYASEIGFLYEEINFFVKRLKQWSQPKPVPTPWFYTGAKSYTINEPYGVALIVSPWNYPFLLTLMPLIGSIAAGNCTIIKPSEYSINSTRLLKKIIAETFDPQYITIVEGSIKETEALLNEKFDFILFTGSTQGGKAIMQAAAKTLTPITLELGGKSPCIVCKDAEIDIAARKIAWAKFMNAGQTCAAPDYILVHKDIKEKFIKHVREYIERFFGTDPEKCPQYCRIINEKHFNRLTALLAGGKVISGGQTNPKTFYIAPTIIDNIFSNEAPILQEEIFGPVMPIIEFDDLRQALCIINSKPKPLAVYLFTKDKETEHYVIKKTSSGGMCINDCMLQSSTPFLPFGGVGASGMGRCHGKATYLTFSNQKSIMQLNPKADAAFRYPPYKKITYFILRLLMR